LHRHFYSAHADFFAKIFAIYFLRRQDESKPSELISTVQPTLILNVQKYLQFIICAGRISQTFGTHCTICITRPMLIFIVQKYLQFIFCAGRMSLNHRNSPYHLQYITQPMLIFIGQKYLQFIFFAQAG
jgi:hypothetical protein